MKADTMFGWKPKPTSVEISPIPLCFGLVQYNTHDLIRAEKLLYLGPRYQTSFKLHERFANKNTVTTQMKFDEETGKLIEVLYETPSYEYKMPKVPLNGEIKVDDAF